MSKRILITGGAGFIGSHLADGLLRLGYRVRVLDRLSEQVHGEEGRRPAYLNPEAELIVGNIQNPQTVRRALRGVEAVFHLAAAVGVGQSMYQVASYTSTNNFGTAVLLEALLERPVKRLIVASSMSIYGEGLYRAPDGRIYDSVERTLEQLKAGQWEPRTPQGEALEPLPTPETKPPSLASIYALSKYDQERMCMVIGRAYDIPTVALRFFNVYGPRQALSNPYTGVLSIFASRLLNDRPPLIYEDGLQRRDFVSIHDVVQACRLALEVPEAAGKAFNVGSGSAFTILEVAHRMARVLGKEGISPQVTGKFRAGDIRHCFADISQARQVLGYSPQVALEEGMDEMAEWLAGQIAVDRVEEVAAELTSRGLSV